MPLGGKILLKFPPNYYSLESSPLPVGSITSNNLEKIDTSQPFFTYKTNVATLSNFKGNFVFVSFKLFNINSYTILRQYNLNINKTI